MGKWDDIKTECGHMEFFLELGTKRIQDNEVQVSVWAPDTTSCDIRIYTDEKRKRYKMHRLVLPEAGGIYTIRILGENIAQRLQGLEYDFVADGTVFADPYAREITGRERFGKKSTRIRARFDFAVFDWSGEKAKKIKLDEMIMYQCHVRGFTRHSSSGTSKPGTFAGLQEKIPYMKKLGVNTLLLLPVYDFDEHIKEDANKINYWGYDSDAFYFAPKQGYASGEQPVTLEFQQLVKALHASGMNVFLDMYFAGKSPLYVLHCLRYYVLRFHIDGFRINDSALDRNELAADPVLSQVRLLGLNWNEQEKTAKSGQLLEMNDRYMIDARRLLKSDEGQVENFYYRFHEQREKVGLVHYITQHDGFTLRDLISYDIKHNEANGERNQDGMEHNYSWNCGVEGPTRRKDVLRWRARQERNALVMLFLGMGIPMLLAGDEFGNSQKGNNNAYCQDNLTTWLDWRLIEKNKPTMDFVKKLIQIRKNKPLYHTPHVFTGMDGKALGSPDVSCHGKEPWDVHFSYYCREIGILYCGEYYDGDSLYFAFNFHWEPHEFFLPVTGANRKWEVLFDTSEQNMSIIREKSYLLQPRSIVLFESKKKRKTRTKNG